jgi:phage terminase large subunit GpA-like protein
MTKTESGLLEIAEILGEKIGYRIIDRQILKHRATKKLQDKKLAALINEHYPTEIENFINMILSETAIDNSNFLMRRTINCTKYYPRDKGLDNFLIK